MLSRKLTLILWALLGGANFACAAWDMTNQCSGWTILNGSVGAICILKAFELWE